MSKRTATITFTAVFRDGMTPRIRMEASAPAASPREMGYVLAAVGKIAAGQAERIRETLTGMDQAEAFDKGYALASEVVTDHNTDSSHGIIEGDRKS